jgi:hypothetical protein
MTALLSLLSFSLPVLTGIFIVHSLWADKNNLFDLILKLSLGTGLGLGISSLLYFAYLFLFAGKPWFLYVEILIFSIVLVLVVRKNKNSLRIHIPRLNMNSTQVWMLVIAGVVFLSSFLGVLNYARQRALGDWDAWMIYNRAARFIYRDRQAWQDSFPKEMSVIFHADYPLLLALNTASRWDILNKETPYVPMFQSILFAFASLGLIFGALARLKSLGQAGLGLILLGGVPFFLYEGGRQTADLPLAFYMLASVVFIFFYYQEKRPILLAFAGLTAGLAAWTKNEGVLFVLVSATVTIIAELRTRSFKSLYTYFAGLLFPLAIVLYFKFQLAPASEFLSGGLGPIAADILDPSRHQIILVYFKNLFLYSGGWYHIGILLILCVYHLVFHIRIKDNPPVVLIGFAIFACQILGYYAFYLISPYELDWHLSSSIDRLFIHVYPTILFVMLAASQTPETILASGPK